MGFKQVTFRIHSQYSSTKSEDNGATGIIMVGMSLFGQSLYRLHHLISVSSAGVVDQLTVVFGVIVTSFSQSTLPCNPKPFLTGLTGKPVSPFRLCVGLCVLSAAYLQLLDTAHDWLSLRSWTCRSLWNWNGGKNTRAIYCHLMRTWTCR